MKRVIWKTGQGFTLVEMLVVISVIILLVTMLMPSLERSFELANRAVCARNLKSAGTAAMQYRNQFGFYPPNWTWGLQGEAPANYNKYETRDGWEKRANWVQAKNPMYPDFVKSLDVLKCPSNVNTTLVDDPRDIDENQPLPSGTSKSKLRGYHLRFDNGRIFYFYEWNHNLSKIQGYAKISGGIQTTENKPPKDEKWHIYWYTKANPSEPARTYVYYEADDGASGSTGAWDGSNHPRILVGTAGKNDAGGNIVFADGHVAWLDGATKEQLQNENRAMNKDKGGNSSLKYGVYSNPYRFTQDLSQEDLVHMLQSRD